MQYVNEIKTFFFQNTSAKQTIFKNTFWLSVSTVVNKLLALALVIYAARVLGAEEYGQFTFALAFVSLLMIFATFGLQPIVTREFAREEEKKEEFYSILSLKLVLAFCTFLLILATSFFVAQAHEIRIVILALGLFFLLNGFIGICYSFFHARQKMEYEAWFETLQTILIIALGLFVLFRFPSPANLSYAYVAAGFVSLVAMFAFFHFKIFPLKLQWDFLVWKKFLKMAWPLALIGLFGVIYSYTDSVMLGAWNMLEETGWYNAAYKIVTASLVPMGFVGAAFYPALSKFSKESAMQLQAAWNHELEIMIVLALPLVAGGMVLASNIIYSFYSVAFAPSILALQILILTAGFVFLYRPFYDVLIVLNQQTKTFWITVAGALLNVALNLILIPKYSLYGAAVATVATHFLVLLAMLFFVKRFTSMQLPLLRILLAFCISSASVSVMYVGIRYLLAYNVNLFLLVPAGATLYFLVFLFLRKYVALRFFKQAYA